MSKRMRDLLASIVIGAQVVLAELDFEAVGLVTAGPDLLKWAAFAPLLFLPIFVLPVFSTRLPRLAVRAPLGWLSLWFAWSMASVVWSLAPKQTILQGGAILGLALSAAWYVSAYGFAKFARVVMIATTGFLAIGLLRDLATGNISLAGEERFFGLSFAATNLARLSLISLLLAFSTARDPRYRTLATGCAMVSGVVLIGTNTRTMVLALLMVGASLAGRRFGWRVGALATVVVALFTIGVISGAGSTDTLSRGDEGGDVASFNGRTTIWAIGLDLFAEEPLKGYGTASGEAIWNEAAKDGQISWFAANAHNIVLELAMSHGLIGVGLVLAGLASFARRSQRESDPWQNALVIAILATGLTESVVNRPSTVFAVLGAVFAARTMALPKSRAVALDPTDAPLDPTPSLVS